MLWLSFIAFIWAIYNPSRRKGELLPQARKRVFVNMLKDSLFWVCLLLVAYSLVRWLNNGINLEYNSEETVWNVSEAFVPFLPSAVKSSGFFEFAASIAFGIVVMSCKYSLGRNARAFYLVSAVFLASLVALAFFFSYILGVERFVELAKCSKSLSSNVGVVFFIYAIGSLFALSSCIESNWSRNLFFLMLSAMTLFVSSVIYSSAYEILAFLISFLVAFFLLATVSVFASSVVSSFKISISALISLVLTVVVLISALPGDVMAEKFPYFFEQALFQDGFLQERGVLSDISLKIWGANRWLGGGLGTFPLELKFAATENEYHSISLMQACPLNGYWHLICENGIIGVSIYTGILLLGFIALLYRVVKAVVNSVKSIEDDDSFFDFATPSFILPFFVVIPLCVSAFVSSSLMRVDVILPLGAFFALGISSVRGEYSPK